MRDLNEYLGIESPGRTREDIVRQAKLLLASEFDSQQDFEDMRSAELQQMHAEVKQREYNKLSAVDRLRACADKMQQVSSEFEREL